METKQGKKESPRTGGWISALKFLPLVVFAALVIVFKLELLLAAPIATFVAILVYIFIYRGNFDGAFEQGLKSARSIIGVFFILMFAYAVAESFIATGVGASLINLALKLGVTGRTVAVISLVVTSLLSVATGTSWGTFAACAPIFLWLSELVGGDPMLTVCAIAGGSCFGDNIGMISDDGAQLRDAGCPDYRPGEASERLVLRLPCPCSGGDFSVQPPSAQCPGGRG